MRRQEHLPPLSVSLSPSPSPPLRLSFTHTQSITHSPTHSPTHPHTHSLTHSLTLRLTHSLPPQDGRPMTRAGRAGRDCPGPPGRTPNRNLGGGGASGRDLQRPRRAISAGSRLPVLGDLPRRDLGILRRVGGYLGGYLGGGISADTSARISTPANLGPASLRASTRSRRGPARWRWRPRPVRADSVGRRRPWAGWPDPCG